MKKFTYFDFLKGEKVTIREILEEEQSPEKNATYFVLALYQTDEKVHIGIESKNAFLVKPNATLFYAVETEESKGYTLWENGIIINAICKNITNSFE